MAARASFLFDTFSVVFCLNRGSFNVSIDLNEASHVGGGSSPLGLLSRVSRQTHELTVHRFRERTEVNSVI